MGVLLVQGDRVVLAEGVAELLLGRSRARLEGALLDEVAPPEAVEVTRRILAGASTCSAAGRLRERGRAAVRLSISGSPGPEAGQVVLVVAPSTDPDAHPRGESFRGRLAWLAGLAAGLAHEIRNPLGGIRGAAQLLARSGRALSQSQPPAAPVSSSAPGVAEEWDELTGLIIQEADRIGDRVARLMALVRPRPLLRTAVSVNVLVHDGVALLRADPAVRRVEWTLDLDPSLPSVEGDPVRLSEAVGNLLRNAAEAADKQVVVRTRVAPEGRFVEEGVDRGLALSLEVQDDGPGIPPDAERDLFVPFATTKLEGSGLGLFVTRLAVEDHAGRITVRPRPEPGDPSDLSGAWFGLLLFETLPPRADAEVDFDRGRRRPLPAPPLETHP